MRSNYNETEEGKYEELELCPHCASKEIRILFNAIDRLTNLPGTFYLSECQKCNLVFQNPRIKEKYIGDFYKDELGYCQPPKSHTVNKSIIKSLIKRHLPRRFKAIYLIFSPQREGDKLLDIGCSHGKRLEKLKELGWDTYGIEMFKKTADYARKERGLKVENKRIEEANFSNEMFDTIIMSMVLEHLYNPVESLEKITRWLKKGGNLMFSIPYFRGLEFRIFKEFSYGLQLPTHITFFNKKIIKEILIKAGYKDIKFYFLYSDRDLIISVNNKYGERRGVLLGIVKFLINKKLIRMCFVKPAIFLLSILGLTSRVCISAIKK